MGVDTESEFDTDKIDEAALALLYLTLHKNGAVVRAWKNIDWDVMDRLHDKGYIFDPRNKAKSVVVTEEGEIKSKELFYALFSKQKA